jgi:UDP-N-acetyl-D-galactosamine dehydrogenase
MEKAHKIAIIGLGYLGLPLAIEFAKKYNVVGYDIDEQRIVELKNLNDRTQEASLTDLKLVMTAKSEANGLHLTSSIGTTK